MRVGVGMSGFDMHLGLHRVSEDLRFVMRRAFLRLEGCSAMQASGGLTLNAPLPPRLLIDPDFGGREGYACSHCKGIGQAACRLLRLGSYRNSRRWAYGQTSMIQR